MDSDFEQDSFELQFNNLDEDAKKWVLFFAALLLAGLDGKGDNKPSGPGKPNE